jgi:hypothetical protein
MKSLTLACLCCFVGGAVPVHAEKANFDFDGAGSGAKNAGLDEAAPFVPNVRSAPVKVPAANGIKTAYITHSHVFSVYSESQARTCLPELVKAFEAAGYAVLVSRCDRNTDAAGGEYWTIYISYLAPKNVEVQKYQLACASESEARAALPGIVKKFHSTGYAILWNWVIWHRPYETVYWYVDVTYILPAK